VVARFVEFGGIVDDDLLSSHKKIITYGCIS